MVNGRFFVKKLIVGMALLSTAWGNPLEMMSDFQRTFLRFTSDESSIWELQPWNERVGLILRDDRFHTENQNVLADELLSCGDDVARKAGLGLKISLEDFQRLLPGQQTRIAPFVTYVECLTRNDTYYATSIQETLAQLPWATIGTSAAVFTNVPGLGDRVAFLEFTKDASLSELTRLIKQVGQYTTFSLNGQTYGTLKGSPLWDSVKPRIVGVRANENEIPISEILTLPFIKEVHYEYAVGKFSNDVGQTRYQELQSALGGFLERGSNLTSLHLRECFFGNSLAVVDGHMPVRIDNLILLAKLIEALGTIAELTLDINRLAVPNDGQDVVREMRRYLANVLELEISYDVSCDASELPGTPPRGSSRRVKERVSSF